MKSKVKTLKFEVESIFLNDEAPALENETSIEADVATIKHESTAEEAEISANRGFLEQMRKSSQEDVELEVPEDKIKSRYQWHGYGTGNTRIKHVITRTSKLNNTR